MSSAATAAAAAAAATATAAAAAAAAATATAAAAATMGVTAVSTEALPGVNIWAEEPAPPTKEEAREAERLRRLEREVMSHQAELQLVRSRAAGGAQQSPSKQSRQLQQLPSRQLAAALAVVSGGRLRLLTTADGVARWCFVRALPSQCALLCDGAKPATLLGALPGLSPAAVAQHRPDADAQARGFRLIGKSYELDVLATSAMEARLWIRGVNTLPFGSKHCALLALARKHHPHLVPRTASEPSEEVGVLMLG